MVCVMSKSVPDKVDSVCIESFLLSQNQPSVVVTDEGLIEGENPAYSILKQGEQALIIQIFLAELSLGKGQVTEGPVCLKILPDSQYDVCAFQFLPLDAQRWSEAKRFLVVYYNELDVVNLSPHLRQATLSRLIHDLRTPLQTIMVVAEKIGADAIDEHEFNEYSNIIQDSAGFLLDQVNNILAQGLLQLGHAVSKDVFILESVVGKCIAMLQPLAAKKDLSVVFNTQGNNTACLGDARLVSSVVQNIVGNAIKYTDNGEIQISISSKDDFADEHTWQVHLEVLDSGVGIDPKKIAMILEPYHTSSSSIGSYEALGLGTNIVKRALQLMDGSLLLSNRSDGGLRAKVDFKLQKGEVFSDTPRSSKVDKGIGVNLRDQTMLIVDDNKVVVDLLSAQLAKFGAKVYVAYEGRQALDLYLSRYTEIGTVILDLTMPGFSGLDLAKSIRKAEAVRATRKRIDRVRVFAFTASSSLQTDQDCSDAGIDYILTKPIAASVFAQKVFEAITSDENRARAVGAMSDEVLINEDNYSEMLNEMGKDMTFRFMTRAIGEAEDISLAFTAPIEPEELAERAHRAIGSAGLTGLTALSLSLKKLEHSLRRGADLAESREHFSHILSLTRQAVTKLE